MKIISLRGPQNSGKTTTLTIVHDKLLEQSSQNSNNCFIKDISNGDILDVNRIQRKKSWYCYTGRLFKRRMLCKEPS